MNIHRRNHLPLAMACIAILSLLWLWQMTLPLLNEQAQALQNRRHELQKRQQAAQAEMYQRLIERLQRPLPAPAEIVAALHKTSIALDLTDANYTLTQPQPLDHDGLSLVSRRLSISLRRASAAAALALWQNLRQALPCEAQLSGFNSEGVTARLELNLIGGSS